MSWWALQKVGNAKETSGRHGMPVWIIEGATAIQACKLIEDADSLLADYDTDEIIHYGEDKGIEIPPKRNRKIQRTYDRELYSIRHLVENAFLEIKRWRATRYAKNIDCGCSANSMLSHLG